jgi:hypothetical protein
MDNKINLADLEKENEQLRRQLAEFDELPNKTGGGRLGDLKGVDSINTGLSQGISSIPRGDDNYYLDLYLLQIERGRLAKEIASIKRRRLHLGRKVSRVDKEIAKKEKKALQNMATLPAESPEKPVKEKVKGKKRQAPKSYEYKEEEWDKLTLEY